MNTQKKNCNSCHLVKDASDFDRGKGTCKDCNRIKRKIRDDKNRTVVREKQRAYAQKNAEQIAERKHKWYEANKDNEMQRMREWREKNKEHRKQYANEYDATHVVENTARRKIYRKKNAERIKNNLKKWCDNNPEKRMEHRRRYGATRRIRSAVGDSVVDRSITLIGVMERDNYTCHICGKHIDFSLPCRHKMSATIDHLFPISFGGSHVWDNVSAAHFRCNSRMKNQLQIP